MKSLKISSTFISLLLISAAMFFTDSLSSQPRKNGHTIIAGTVTLPEGHMAPKGGMTIDLTTIIKDYEYMTKHAFGQSVTIAENAHSAPFSLIITTTDASRYRIRYFNPYAGYLRSGYYSRSGTVPFQADTPDMWIDISKGNVDGIVLTIPADPKGLSFEDYKKESVKAAKAIVKNIIKPHYTDFEKILVLHDYLITNMEYYSDEGARSKKLSSYQDIYNDYIPLISGIGICGTYSSSFEFMARQCALNSRHIKARIEIADHAWSAVSLDDRWYHIDATVNDNPDLKLFSYSVFMLTDQQMEAVKKNRSLWDHENKSVPDEPFAFSDAMYPHKSALQSDTYKRVLGNIRLPAGQFSPDSGMWVTVSADIPNTGSGARVFIPRGKNYAFYALQVPRNAGVPRFTLRLSSDNPSYLNHIYYSGTRAVTESDRAVQYAVNGPDIVVDMQLISGFTRSMLPLLEPVRRLLDGKTTILIRNRETGGYLAEANGRVIGVRDRTDACLWKIEKIENQAYYRILNARTGHGIHIENRNEALECSAYGNGWHSAHWQFSGASGNSVYIENRWQKERIAATPQNIVVRTLTDPENIRLSQWEIIAGHSPGL